MVRTLIFLVSQDSVFPASGGWEEGRGALEVSREWGKKSQISQMTACDLILIKQCEETASRLLCAGLVHLGTGPGILVGWAC